MKHCTVQDVMAADAVTATTSTAFKDLAETLVRRRLSGLPVLSRQGQVVGVVCESDLLMKEEAQRDPGARPPGRPRRRALRAKAAGDTAGDVMTTRPVTVRPDTTVAEAARLMDRHHASCLPVIGEDGKLAGTVSRRDLLRVFLRRDSDIRAEVTDEVLVRYLGTNPVLVSVDVTDGVVTLSGEVACKSMLPLVLPATRAVDGVVDVEGHLTYGVDDTRRPPVPNLRAS
jgi:CBS-domain-containing membrane protein